MLSSDLIAALEYQGAKFIDEALYEAAAGLLERFAEEGVTPVEGMDEAIRLPDGRVFAITWGLKEVPAEEVAACGS